MDETRFLVIDTHALSSVKCLDTLDFGTEGFGKNSAERIVKVFCGNMRKEGQLSVYEKLDSKFIFL